MFDGSSVALTGTLNTWCPSACLCLGLEMVEQQLVHNFATRIMMIICNIMKHCYFYTFDDSVHEHTGIPNN